MNESDQVSLFITLTNPQAKCLNHHFIYHWDPPRKESLDEEVSRTQTHPCVSETRHLSEALSGPK